ncbi:MAG: undecaprenyl/decaprenyl-phosphate alpha-N-acetylglucosaminyl 1-phosphate transferase [Firmicutes bacterium]|nr:undecaprenyl/decaprenyl-phosphate alpha-N-acetylglucosaminyl 1-phosphate transferase [Bacillota bacterium]
MWQLAAALGVAYLAVRTVTPWVARKAWQWQAVDPPGARKVHHRPVPRLGGLAVACGFLAGLAVAGVFSGPLLGLLAGALIVLAVGSLDDVYGLTPLQKLAGQTVAAVAVVPLGLRVEFLTNPLTGQPEYLGWLGWPITVIWLVAVTNALNLIDGLDGLAAGTATIAAAVLAAVVWVQGSTAGIPEQAAMAAPALILAASTLSFLRYNFHPARIFLGDSGSLFLGFTLGGLAVLGVAKSTTAVSVFIPIMVLGVPLFDTTLAVLRRCFKRHSIFAPDREHVHHRLLEAGFSHKRAVLILYGVNLVLGLSAFLLNFVTSDGAMVILSVVAGLVLLGANRVEAKRRSLRARACGERSEG